MKHSIFVADETGFKKYFVLFQSDKNDSDRGHLPTETWPTPYSATNILIVILLPQTKRIFPKITPSRLEFDVANGKAMMGFNNFLP
jgi:hypothetical protein